MKCIKLQMPKHEQHFYWIYFVIFLREDFEDQFEFLIHSHHQYYLHKYDEWHLMHDIEYLTSLDHSQLNDVHYHRINLIVRRQLGQQW